MAPLPETAVPAGIVQWCIVFPNENDRKTVGMNPNEVLCRNSPIFVGHLQPQRSFAPCMGFSVEPEGMQGNFSTKGHLLLAKTKLFLKEKPFILWLDLGPSRRI